MKVELINYTQDAIALLLYTKNTRLQGCQSIQDIKNWPSSKKLEHLKYMRNTIQSSWEFVDYTFHISGVTRAFTHQLVRTRQGSYAQQSQRTVDVSDQEVINTSDNPDFDMIAGDIKHKYRQWIKDGMKVQDARGILPTNITTEIIAKFDLRTLHNMALVRLCKRTQGEYQKVFQAMKNEVLKVHPWASDFIKAQCSWDGTCAFPLYTECPIQGYTIKASEEAIYVIEDAIENTDFEATPVAKNGRTM